MTTIAFIGLGNMGLPMTLNLIEAGHQVHVFDLAAAPLLTAEEAGAIAFKSAVDACKNVDMVISMLPAGKHVKQLYLGDDSVSSEGLIHHLSTSTLVIDCSTIDAETARLVHQASLDLDIDMLDAPVSGGVAAAQSGTLTFMCGGNDVAFNRGKGVLKSMGLNIFHAGQSGSGQVAKMCNNMLLAIHMIGTSEALKLGENNGLDASVLSEIMLASSGKNWSLEKYNPYPNVMKNSPASNNYQPGFMVDLMTKDLGLAISNAQSTASNTPLGSLAYELYQQKQSAGDGQRDFSSIIELLS
jgi:3-hydroxyisobutyrate dehydrogenase